MIEYLLSFLGGACLGLSGMWFWFNLDPRPNLSLTRWSGYGVQLIIGCILLRLGWLGWR
jgi:hypothetical protein